MKVLRVCLAVTTIAAGAAAFDFYSYWEPPMTGAGGSVAVADDARGVSLNPAALAAGHGFNGYLSTFVQPVGDKNVHAYADTALGGFGYDWMKTRGDNVPLYKNSRFTWAYGAPVYRWAGAGVGLNRLAASKPYLTAAWTVDAGCLLRPSRHLSFGLTARNINQPHFLRRLERRTYIAGLGVRPLGERLTLAGDVGWREGDAPGDAGWRVGADVELVPGLTVGANVDDDKSVGAGVSFGLPNVAVGYDARLDENGDFTRDNVNARFNVERRRSFVAGGKRYVEVDVSGHLQEGTPGFSLFGGGTSAREIIREMEAAREDPGVRGVILRVGNIGMTGLADEIRDEIKKARAEGKKVYAYVEDVMAPGGYYVAASADVVTISPDGVFTGVGGYESLWRIKGLAERFGIEFEYATAGKYKGASSQFFAGPPTEEQLEEYRAVVEDVYGRFLRDAAADRGLAVEGFKALYEGPLLNPRECRAAGLVDEVARYEDLKDLIARADKTDELNAAPAAVPKMWNGRWGRPRKVRVILAEGFILRGESGRLFPFGPKTIGSDTVVGQIKDARRDPEVGAVVLRVNSGGGDGLASDDIYRELKKCGASGKVVVASMASVAASGGYMISCGAERIYAEPDTITASIGVFSQKIVLENLYKKYGIEEYIIKPHEHADAMSPSRRLTDEEMAWLDKATREAYDDFVRTVAEARGLDNARVAEIAEGRVYTGAVAKDLGLVDEMGGLDDAVVYARAKAGLGADAPVEYVGWEEGFMGRLMRAAGTLAGM